MGADYIAGLAKKTANAKTAVDQSRRNYEIALEELDAAITQQDDRVLLENHARQSNAASRMSPQCDSPERDSPAQEAGHEHASQEEEAMVVEEDTTYVPPTTPALEAPGWQVVAASNDSGDGAEPVDVDGDKNTATLNVLNDIKGILMRQVEATERLTNAVEALVRSLAPHTERRA